jgi:hypothetical protein
MHLVAAVLCIGGFAALAVATQRQQLALLSRGLAPGTTRALRGAGTALLVVALAALVAEQGWGLGLVAYSGHTSLAAGIVYCALIIAARRRSG